MECWVHAGVEASGLCVQCGKAGCGQCLTAIGGCLVCRTCANRIEGRAVEENQPPAPPPNPRTWMAASLLVAVAFAGMGVVSLTTMGAKQPAGNPPAGVMAFFLIAYAWLGWATAWTLPPILKWFHVRAVKPVVRAVRYSQSGCLPSGLFALLTYPVLWYILFWPALVMAMLYGMFGGGVREMLRCRREWARAQAPPATSAQAG